MTAPWPPPVRPRSSFSDPIHLLKALLTTQISITISNAMAALATLAPVTRARNAARDTQTQPCSSPRANNPGVLRRNALLSSVVGTVLSGGGKLDAVRADEEEALPRPTRPASCVAGTSCVSTASFRSPANYLPPWEYVGDDAQAFKTLVDALRSKPKADVTVVDANAGYVAASLRHDDSSSDVDDLEFFFLNDGSGAVLFRWAGRVNVASPPGCFKPGCINGPRQRARAEDLQRELGWLPLETDEEKQWVPLLLH